MVKAALVLRMTLVDSCSDTKTLVKILDNYFQVYQFLLSKPLFSCQRHIDPTTGKISNSRDGRQDSCICLIIKMQNWIISEFLKMHTLVCQEWISVSLPLQNHSNTPHPILRGSDGLSVTVQHPFLDIPAPASLPPASQHSNGHMTQYGQRNHHSPGNIG